MAEGANCGSKDERRLIGQRRVPGLIARWTDEVASLWLSLPVAFVFSAEEYMQLSAQRERENRRCTNSIAWMKRWDD